MKQRRWCVMCSFYLFQIKVKLIYIISFWQFYINLQSAVFQSRFQPQTAKSWTHSGTPKVRLAAKNIPFLQKTSTTSYVIKTTPLYAFCVRGCVASHVESDPPPALCVEDLLQAVHRGMNFSNGLTWLTKLVTKFCRWQKGIGDVANSKHPLLSIA